MFTGIYVIQLNYTGQLAVIIRFGSQAILASLWHTYSNINDVFSCLFFYSAGRSSVEICHNVIQWMGAELSQHAWESWNCFRIVWKSVNEDKANLLLCNCWRFDGKKKRRGTIDRTALLMVSISYYYIL